MKSVLLCSGFLLAACSMDIQGTSGKAYLASDQPGNSPIAAANYEPELHFPARIGLVRLVHGAMTLMPERERLLFAGTDMSALGEVVTLGPLEAQLFKTGRFWATQDNIRALAASRHLDFVLVVQLDPEHNSAEAVFLDVRSGYPYASLESIRPGRGRTNLWGNRMRNQNRINAANYRLVEHIRPKLGEMFQELAKQAAN
ncbi:MAG: hypothetical protein ACRBB0_23915 [Pelagimonas sp.]|uniref:hypothetical protein n=1 Tax=Pelagimonas sp. TaxID=2073170 RepID=UPI003D6C0BB0